MPSPRCPICFGPMPCAEHLEGKSDWQPPPDAPKFTKVTPMVSTPQAPSSALADNTTVSKDVLRKRNAEQQTYILKINEQLAVVTRIATLAVARLGGTMRIGENEWMSAEGSDMQWRTVRHLGLQPEIHVAATLQGETVVTHEPPPN